MFFEARTFFLIYIALAIFARANGQKNKNDSSSSSEENADDLVPTYRTPIEVIFQGLVGAISDVTSKASDGDSNGIGGLLDKIVPTPIQKVLEPVEKITVKGFGDLLNLFEDKFHAIYPGKEKSKFSFGSPRIHSFSRARIIPQFSNKKSNN